VKKAGRLTTADGTVENTEAILAWLNVHVRPRLAVPVCGSGANSEIRIDACLHMDDIAPQSSVVIRIEQERAIRTVCLRAQG